MTQYDKAMGHFRNHRKDRYCQPCSGPVNHVSVPACEIPADQFDKISHDSIQEIITTNKSFPIYVKQDLQIGKWEIVPSNNLFGYRIDSHIELLQFAMEYA